MRSFEPTTCPESRVDRQTYPKRRFCIKFCITCDSNNDLLLDSSFHIDPDENVTGNLLSPPELIVAWMQLNPHLTYKQYMTQMM